MFYRYMIWMLLAAFALSACEGITTPMPPATPTPTDFLPDSTATATLFSPAAKVSSGTFINALTATPSPTPLPEVLGLDPTDWKDWPVIPIVPEHVREIYAQGQSLGNDPHAFSIFGDCQSKSGVFLGVYETDPQLAASQPVVLQETIANFQGSFNRDSPTSQDGTTPGALLWTQWHRGLFGCSFAETPVDCELRIHHPSFVIIQIGTHFESRNTDYLRRIIQDLIDHGVVPILATKADNREKDDRINKDMANLAIEFNLPLWNFWASLSNLPNRGLYVMKGRENQGAVYLDDEASARHRFTGLQALSIVWHSAIEK
jgi:hypothetical protein